MLLASTVVLAAVSRVPITYNLLNLAVRWPTASLTLFAFTIVVGRIEEVRMFFPLAAPLVVVGVLGWRAVLASRPPAPSSSAVAATQGSDGVREGSAADGADPDRAPSLAT